MIPASWDWRPIARDDWERLFAAAGRSSLPQCWAYGEAKAQCEGWRVRRGILRGGADGAALALVQVLEKRLAFVGRVARINRGPVWLAEPQPSQAAAAWRALRGQWRWWRAGALFAAPEITLDGESASLPAALGFARRGEGWSSAWIDLARPEAELRAALKGKWRNMLVGAEKAALTLDADDGEAAFAWLLERYGALMAEKDFVGPPAAVLTALRAARHRPDDLLVLRAMHEGQGVAGVLVARHGDAATYLVGWNGPEGRPLKANHFLLWQAALEMRRRNCRWFDLGGIDANATPGIAHFKQGMGGQDYRLVGEYRSL